MKYLLCLLLAGCATPDRDHSYNWQHHTDSALTYEWHQQSPEMIERLCGKNMMGCSKVFKTHCVVYSLHTESVARTIIVGQFSHFDHEVAPGSRDGKVFQGAWMGHCAGWKDD